MKTKKFEWNIEKNEILKKNRKLCFEDAENAISGENFIGILPHHNAEKYPNQKIFVVRINGYIHYIPFVEDNETYFLKSIIPSRKLNNTFL